MLSGVFCILSRSYAEDPGSFVGLQLHSTCYLVTHGADIGTVSCHIITLAFSTKGSSDFLQVPWERGSIEAEACSGDNVGA